MKTRIFIFVVLFAAVFMLQSQTQVGQNLWGDAMHDRFGWSVGIGNTDGSLAVGAPYADMNGRLLMEDVGNSLDISKLGNAVYIIKLTDLESNQSLDFKIIKN